MATSEIPAAPAVATVNQAASLQGETPNSTFALYVPHDIKYDSAFEDGLMELLLKQPNLSPNHTEAAVQQDDVPRDGLPVIGEDDLPLSILDSRRKYPGPIPGVRLTHPGGYLEGGPGLDPEMDTFVEDFVERNSNISSQSNEEALRNAVRREIDHHFELLKERMRERQKAHQQNEQIDKELKLMSEQHSMEMKINRRLADQRRAKKEAKDKKRTGEK